MSKRLKIVILVLVILIGLGLLARSCRAKHTIPVKVAAVRRGTIEETVPTTSAGYLKALRDYTATAPLGGRVEKILKRVGDPVQADEVIVTLDKEDLQNKVKIEETNLESSRTRVRSLEIKLKGLEVDYQRVYKLGIEENVLPRSKVEDAYQALEVARGELKNAKAQIEQFQSTVKLSRDQLGRKDLSAPFGGVLANLNVSEGQTLLPNQPAFSVVDPSSLRVEASVDEVDSPKIHQGQIAYISPDAFPDKRFEGRLSSVAPVITLDKKMSRVVKIEVDLPGQPELLRAGMSVDVEIVVSRKDGILYVPGRTILVRDRKANYVWTVSQRRSRAEKRVVKLGIESWNRIEVFEGLNEGEKVIFSIEDPEKLDRLRQGARVEVVGEEAAEEDEEGAAPRTRRAGPEVPDLAGLAAGSGEAAEGAGAQAGPGGAQ